MARIVHYRKGFRPCTLYMMRRYYQVSLKKERDKSRLCFRWMTGLRLDKTLKVSEMQAGGHCSQHHLSKWNSCLAPA